MKKILLALTFLTIAVSANAQNIPARNTDQIIAMASAKDTVFIINFWATWCAPCVAELPEFNALQQRYAGKPVKIIMVSLDFKEDYPMKLAGFVQRKRLQPEVVWLTDTDPNVFIPKIENSWQGSIPATIVVSTGKQFKKFIEGSVTEKEIKNIVDKLL